MPPSRALSVRRSHALSAVNAPRIEPAAPSGWLRVRAPALALGLTIAGLTLHALVLGAPVPWAQSFVFGGALLAGGFAWAAWAWVTFQRNGTPWRAGRDAGVLVDDGPYRFGRNPMLLGIVAMMLGVALVAGAPLLWISAANFVAIVATVHIPDEEARLQHAFGGWYSDYAASVRRWL